MPNYTWAYGGNPYHPANNVNGIDPGEANAVHTLAVPAVVALEDAYVRHVIDTVNDLDNVLYEISNESNIATVPWQYHMIDLVHNYEKSKPKQHPVGMTAVCEWPGPTNHFLFESKAEWVSPVAEGDYYEEAGAGADGTKVVIADTDHLHPDETHPPDRLQLIWTTITRGMNFLLMDDLDNDETLDPAKVPVRKNMGIARSYAERMNLAAAKPRNDLASTKYCLSDGMTQFLVLLPKGGTVTINLGGALGRFNVEWINTMECKSAPAEQVAGGASVTLTAPFSGPAAVFLWKQ